MILFYDLSENSAEAVLEKLPLPKSDALEIIESYADADAEVAVSGAFGCLIVRICDDGEYLFSYPYSLTESADESGAVEEVAQYAIREGLPLVFFDVPRDSLPVLLMGFRHADVDAEGECAETYRVTIKSECMLIKNAPKVTSGAVTLRELRYEDRENYARICLDTDNNKYWGYDFRDDEPDADAEFFINSAITERKIGMAISFAVISDGEFVGEATLYAFDCRGGAEMAIRILFDICRSIGLVRLYAEAFAENKPSVVFCSKYMERLSDDGGRVVFIKNFYEP